MYIEICKWDEYQKEAKRYETAKWFALSNQIWLNPLWDELDGNEFKAYVFLLSQVSQRSHKNGGIETSTKTLSRLSGCSEKVFKGLIEKLCNHGVITVASRGHHSETHELHNTTEHNITEQDRKARSARTDFDFESLYKAYPLKKGKTKGMVRVRAEVKTREDFDSLALAIQRYAETVSREKTEPKYMLHFSTFMGRWRDFLEPDYGEVSKTETKQELVVTGYLPDGQPVYGTKPEVREDELDERGKSVLKALGMGE